MVQEVRLHPSDLIAPLFVQEGQGAPQPVGSMPDVFRLSLAGLVAELPPGSLWVIRGLPGAAESDTLVEDLRGAIDTIRTTWSA